jgi:hypothetical protein
MSDRTHRGASLHHPARLLIALPLGTYLLSYLYLAIYHERLWLFGTVIHEGGTFTLLQTVFYASHMLGHLPSLTVIALLFTGTGLMLLRPETRPSVSPFAWAAILAVFLALCTVTALVFFGREDALAFFTQTKQGVAIFAEGGSWNLHLPSTMLLFAALPVYLILAAGILKIQFRPSSRGALFVITAAALTALFTVVFNSDPLGAVVTAWTDPRYLAHSVRELATFTITYFPLPLSLLAFGPSGEVPPPQHSRRDSVWIVVLLGVTAAAFVYQCYVPLTAGIGDQAQKPPFAKSGSLSVPYLLASHYFEHVLDTIYFTLLALLLWSVAARRREAPA